MDPKEELPPDFQYQERLAYMHKYNLKFTPSTPEDVKKFKEWFEKTYGDKKKK